MARQNDSYTQSLSRAIEIAFKAYKAGKDISVERLYKSFLAQAKNVVGHHFRSSAYDPTLGRDIARRAMMALEQFRGESKISTWFYRIAQNEANRALREFIKGRERSISLDAIGDEALYPSHFEKDACRRAQARESTGNAKLMLQRLGKTLPAEQGTVISLMAEGFSLEEIAERIEEPLGTVRSRYRLAKKRMEAQIGKNASSR
jgi:RNA polymerase sigma factor (sigma-70 family)